MNSQFDWSWMKTALLAFQITAFGIGLLYEKETKSLKFSLGRLLIFVTLAAVVCGVYRLATFHVAAMLSNAMLAATGVVLVKQRQDQGVWVLASLATLFLVMALVIAVFQ